MFERILIANRGEIAARVARTCRRIGADTVSIRGDHELEALHVQATEESIVVAHGRTIARTAFLHAVIEGAHSARCQAIHPGYGVFDDDPAFFREVERAGIVPIGPSPELTVLMRDRAGVRAAAIEAGVRVLPATDEPLFDEAEVRAAVEALGFPLVVRTAFGSGEPPALTVWRKASEMNEWLHEHEPPFAIVLERFLDRPRHIEVYVASDGENVAVLGDLECSVRKDHRRLVAESPAPAIDALHRGDTVRSAVWAGANDLVTLLGFRGVGAMHALFDAEGRFYFSGFRPSLGPEHALIETCANVDLVEVEVRLALGEPLDRAVRNAEPTGHAVLGRIECATDPRDNRPFPARVEEVRWPPAPAGKVRIEAGVQAPAKITGDDDALLATVTTYAPNRHEAVLLLDRIIAETKIAPATTNLRLLRRALNLESFRAAQIDEETLDRAGAG